MSVIVEQAKISDLETLYAIEKECFTLEAFSKAEIVSLLKKPNSISLWAKVGTEVVGFIIALVYKGKDAKIGHIFTLDVAVKARKRGVGLRLLEELEQALRKRRVKDCYLEVRADNVAARELYRKLGYVEIGTLEGFYAGRDGIRMKKTLQ